MDLDSFFTAMEGFLQRQREFGLVMSPALRLRTENLGRPKTTAVSSQHVPEQ
ncbi:hypothetical protein [Tichowtungia aerotolerans]|uniref:Uncharacterized protein n=1 Tax=Tichowtungia aerotolerans TaxID=2697043 RepID=A0A6P1MDG0_9BACT|nr:hypothetical protein [Tichowtungia aerotolerans]QHI70108.1 hypothetical protein GT409_11855 [Tichowtungia aerotolerans]